jgi:hypothetical protein
MLGVPVTAFKKDAVRRDHDDAVDRPLPEIFTDGFTYYRPYEDGYEPITITATERELRYRGFRHRTATGCEMTPLELALYRIDKEKRVDYAGPLCGRPAGFWKEGSTRVLCTRGPKIIPARQGDWNTLEKFFYSLFGDGQDPFFYEQWMTFAGWIAHGRHALRNPSQHMPGQALALVGPRDCGKSLTQGIITPALGGREADPSLWLVKGSDFNGSMWRGEHLRLGDEELVEDSRDRHALRDRLKKALSADLFPLHQKHREALDFRPIWRISISCNDDSGSLAVLPPLSEDFADKIIFLKCYPPPEPYHSGSEDERRAFWERLMEGIPGFIHEVENMSFPAEFRKSRFFVREFHHPHILELMADAAPVAAIGELILKWLGGLGGQTEGSAMEIFENLRTWYQDAYDTKNFSTYSSSPTHFSHQLRKLKDLPEWGQRISKGERFFGPHRQKQTVWKVNINT